MRARKNPAKCMHPSKCMLHATNTPPHHLLALLNTHGKLLFMATRKHDLRFHYNAIATALAAPIQMERAVMQLHVGFRLCLHAIMAVAQKFARHRN